MGSERHNDHERSTLHRIIDNVGIPDDLKNRGRTWSKAGWRANIRRICPLVNKSAYPHARRSPAAATDASNPTAKTTVLLSCLCDGLYVEGVVLLPLELRKGALCFAGERFLEAAGQSLIEGSARFGFLAGLELRHSQVKKRIGIERPFPSGFLE